MNPRGLSEALDYAIGAVVRIRIPLLLRCFGRDGRTLGRVSFRFLLLKADRDGIEIIRGSSLWLGWLMHAFPPTVTMEFPR